MQSQAEIVETTIAEDRSANHREMACVRLEFLEFDAEDSSELDKGHWKQLIRVFETRGCLRLELKPPNG